MREFMKLFLMLLGLFAAIAGLGFLGRKKSDQYIEVYGNEDEEEDAF